VSQTGGTVGRGVPFPRVHRPELDCQDIRSISISLGLKAVAVSVHPSPDLQPKVKFQSPHVMARAHTGMRSHAEATSVTEAEARGQQTRTADRPSDWSATTSPPRPPTPRFGSTVSTRRTHLLPPSPPSPLSPRGASRSHGLLLASSLQCGT